MGAKLLLNDEIFYGWIKIEVESYFHLILFDFACTVGYENDYE